ncbi:hypothetical protein PHSY_004962 [Pseudozyma hubeiensis SY62]|uniref:Uncharacterized protein n=1 Tax=Pseudozyma hubeiensis (strain SY62) TaxID=1305764 RepID=R9P818_PSEHS|nr:hypothetical protein PHSY_004962 [Pseudozyma hubeiensis SY62]GAC97377.1 hypothetical protein PHSY_004962 [Pseudozyma hubeiensis SY62]
MASSPHASRPAASRSLPSITVFNHPAARLIKTVPQLQPPTRVNAHVINDTLGIGRTSSTDVVLTDVHGPLSLLVVPDPLDPTIATLVLSIGFQDNRLQGAARRFVLPFRSFKRDPITGRLVSQSQVNGFDAADRKIYPGLGAGLKGLDGGSFWFFEDIGEQGALDRFRWEKDNVGRRAIWTVWLISTPAPVVLHLQNLLQSYPAPVVPLPPWLKERNGFPWQDSYLQQTIIPPSPHHAQKPQIPRSDPQTTASLLAEPKHLGQESSSVTIRDTPQGSSRSQFDAAAPPEYRNSLVAVDNLTGQIAGVLASQVDLDASSPSSDQASSGSSDDDHTGLDDEDEIETPLDEHIRPFQHTSPASPLGLLDESKLLPSLPADLSIAREEKALPNPRASSIIATTPRPSSVLAADTFSPPPLPAKQSNSPKRDTLPSRPTSSVSAAFFTAESDTDAMSSHDSDALEIDPRSLTHDGLPSSFTSIRGKAVERHRPELLRDLVDDAGAESDASGSTVGGPAVRMWRKARGKSKKKQNKVVTSDVGADGAVGGRPAIRSRQVSELSDRTSKAVTAAESLSDDDVVNPDIQPQQQRRSSTDPKSSPETHLPRSALRTDQVRSIEDQVWREALEGGQLPIDAPYTHLAARGDAIYPSSILSSPRSIADGSAIELLSVDEKSRKRRQQTQRRAERKDYMQGGTVLIEFLAGSSRIGASLIRSAGLDASSVRGEGVEGEAKESSRAGGLASNVLGYMPLLPQHLLSFFGLSSTVDQPAAMQTDTGASTSPANLSASFLPNLTLPTIPSWISTMLSFNPFYATTPPTNITDAEAEGRGDDSRAEEWEYAIPEFDPTSLSSTPRPVYRRKRPVPSAVNGFNIASVAAKGDAEADGVGKPAEPDAQQSGKENSRYSILHFDSLGVGRRAFLRGLPADAIRW